MDGGCDGGLSRYTMDNSPHNTYRQKITKISTTPELLGVKIRKHVYACINNTICRGKLD